MSSDKRAEIFITSDTYFGRKSMINNKSRGFSNVDMMNEAMIEIWNETVSNDDTVFHLGNFAWDPITSNQVLERLNAKVIYFLEGTHDKALRETYHNHDKIDLLQKDIIKLDNEKLILSYYPLADWRNRSKGYIHFHGYNNAKTELSDSKRRNVNVKIDKWSLKPVSLTAIRDFITMQEDAK